jgi:DNA-binding NtrC family response regulator
METPTANRVKIILLGLEGPVAAELGDVLSEQQQEVVSAPLQSIPECLDVVDQEAADVVFCPADGRQYAPLLEAIGQRWPELPVIVVSRMPEVSEWLDAIEAGAADYCAAPFESAHIQWILSSTVRQPQSETLYRTAG